MIPLQFGRLQLRDELVGYDLLHPPTLSGRTTTLWAGHLPEPTALLRWRDAARSSFATCTRARSRRPCAGSRGSSAASPSVATGSFLLAVATRVQDAMATPVEPAGSEPG